MSVDMTYLRRAVAAGARIYSDFRVRNVIARGATATGVEGRIRNGENGAVRSAFRIHGKRVVIAAGAFCTPLILERSGVGKRSGELGKNLTLHPGYRMMARFDERIEHMGHEGLFKRLEGLGELARAAYDQPDAGIWELRSRERVHTGTGVHRWHDTPAKP